MRICKIKPLKTLEQHEQEVMDEFNGIKKTGIKCPNCEYELIYPSSFIYDSYPAQRDVKCRQCGLHRSIYV